MYVHCTRNNNSSQVIESWSALFPLYIPSLDGSMMMASLRWLDDGATVDSSGRHGNFFQVTTNFDEHSVDLIHITWQKD